MRLSILVGGIRCYGNVGDVLETAPFFNRLINWDIGDIDAVFHFNQVPIGEKYATVVPHENCSYLFRPGIRGTYRYNPSRSYDVAICAPGPHCDLQRFSLAKTDRPTIIFGNSFRQIPEAQLIKAVSGADLRLVVVREPESYDVIQPILESGCAGSNVRLIMGGDPGFSYPEIMNSDLFHALKKQISHDLPKSYSLIFTRADEPNVKLEFDRRAQRFEIIDTNNGKSWQIVGNPVLATTDCVIDRDMFNEFATTYPNVPQYVCKTVEEAWALISEAKEIYTTRYHPGVISLAVGTTMTILPHALHPNKMNGMDRIRSGLSSGHYELNNDVAWHAMKETLDHIASEKRAAQ